MQNAIREEDIAIVEVIVNATECTDLDYYHSYTEFDLTINRPVMQIPNDIGDPILLEPNPLAPLQQYPWVLLVDLKDLTMLEYNCSDYWDKQSGQSLEAGMQACLDQHR